MRTLMHVMRMLMHVMCMPICAYVRVQRSSKLYCYQSTEVMFSRTLLLGSLGWDGWDAWDWDALGWSSRIRIMYWPATSYNMRILILMRKSEEPWFLELAPGRSNKLYSYVSTVV
jgi:hypothetical protein